VICTLSLPNRPDHVAAKCISAEFAGRMPEKTADFSAVIKGLEGTSEAADKSLLSTKILFRLVVRVVVVEKRYLF